MSTQFAPAQGAKGAASGPRAGFWARLAAAILDGIITGIPFVVVFAAVPDAAIVAYPLWLVVNIAYFVYYEGGPTGQTIGKKALNIRVIDINGGGPIGGSRAFVRWLVEIPSGFVIYLGYLWMLWDPQKQTWHDKAAKTVVVPVRDYPV